MDRFWEIECEGEFREVYSVEAETEEEARKIWEEGKSWPACRSRGAGSGDHRYPGGSVLMDPINPHTFQKEFEPLYRKPNALIDGSIALLRLSMAEQSRDPEKIARASAICEELGLIGKECR